METNSAKACISTPAIQMLWPWGLGKKTRCAIESNCNAHDLASGWTGN